MTRWTFFCIKELHRLPAEVERDNPDMTLAEIYTCFAVRNMEKQAYDDMGKE